MSPLTTGLYFASAILITAKGDTWQPSLAIETPDEHSREWSLVRSKLHSKEVGSLIGAKCHTVGSIARLDTPDEI